MWFVWLFLIFVVFGITVSLPRWFIDTAWERKGKWLSAAEAINGLCIFVAAVGIIGTLGAGLDRIFDPYFYELLLAAGALAFTVYFYIAKNEAKRAEKLKPLTPKAANEIVRQYGEALARGCPDDGVARYASYLPCTREEIIQAFKLVLAFEIEHKSLTQKNYDLLVPAIMYLDSFVADDRADRINRGGRDFENKEYWEFIPTMASAEIREEIDNFLTQVEAMDSEDTLFHQRVYTLIGLPYSPDIEKKYWNIYSDDDD